MLYLNLLNFIDEFSTQNLISSLGYLQFNINIVLKIFIFADQTRPCEESDSVNLKSPLKVRSYSENYVEDLFDDDWNDLDMENIKV